MSQTSMSLPFVMLVISLLACDSPSTDSASPPEDHCNDISRAAADFVRASQACTSDAECTLTSVDAPCVLQCSAAVNKSTDLAAFSTRLDDFAAAYNTDCAIPCWSAVCADPQGLYAHCGASGHCETSRVAAIDGADGG